jgi:hypothetical protein
VTTKSYIERQLEKPPTIIELIDMGVDVTRPRRRGIMVRIAKIEKFPKREPWNCTCSHTRKHHKRSGRCRGSCSCTAGASRGR